MLSLFNLQRSRETQANRNTKSRLSCGVKKMVQVREGMSLNICSSFSYTNRINIREEKRHFVTPSYLGEKFEMDLEMK